MFKFNELSIINDKIVIDVQIEEGEEYKDCYISEMSMSNQNNYKSDSIEGESPLDFITLLSLCSAGNIKVGNKWIFNMREDYEESSFHVSDWSLEVVSISEDLTNYIITANVDLDSPGLAEIFPTAKSITLQITVPQNETSILKKEFATSGTITYTDDSTAPISDMLVKPTYTSAVEVKSVRLELSSSNLTPFNYTIDDLLFIYVMAGGDMSGIPCSDKGWDVKPVVNTKPFYCTGMSYIKELGDTCNISRNFMDYILRMKAFELSLRTGNYTTAINFYNILNHKKTRRSTGGCNCGHN